MLAALTLINQNLIEHQIQDCYKLKHSTIHYGCAFENGFNPSTIFIDEPIIFEDSKLRGIWRPRNIQEFNGPIRLRRLLFGLLTLFQLSLFSPWGLIQL